ncbi:MAG: ribbon-helix-helix protein, CopG family [Acidimicrobiales bacterium]
MAKVMVSLPDELLRAVDVEARRRKTTRSGLLRELAEETLRLRSCSRAERMREIDAIARDAEAIGHGGHVAAVVKASRPEP